MHFQKEDLELGHYSWNDKSGPIFNGQPSRRLFDRFNGDQVLFLINFYLSSAEKFTLVEGRMIEHALFNGLPTDVKSEISVFNWIQSMVTDKINSE